MNWQLKNYATDLITLYTSLNLAGFAQIDWKLIQLNIRVAFHLLGGIAFILAWDAQETA